MKKIYEILKSDAYERELFAMLLESNKNSQLIDYKELVSERGELTDVEASLLLFGKISVNTIGKLRQDLSQILIRSILASDSELRKLYEGDYQKLGSYKATVAARILLSLGYRQSAIDLLSDSIKFAIKMQYSETIVTQAKLLTHHYSNFELNKYKYDKYLNILLRAKRNYDAEILADRYRSNVNIRQMISAQRFDKTYLKELANNIRELKALKDINTIEFIVNRFICEFAFLENTGNVNQMVALCESVTEEVTHIAKGRIIYTAPIWHRKLYALIHNGLFQDCIKEGIEILNVVKRGSLIWYLVFQHISKASLYAGEFKNAYINLQIILEEMKRKQAYVLKEYLELTFGYLVLLGYPNSFYFEKYKGSYNFGIAKFLNSTPIFSKDKRGINIAILLLHVGFLLQKHKWDEAIDRIESLQRYAGRYLRKDENFRSNVMIKMLGQMAKAGFHPIKTERYTAPLRKRLDDVPLTGSGGNIEVEIIPFEVLWDIMMKAIQPSPPRRGSK